jgi:hypothetical protein
VHKTLFREVPTTNLRLKERSTHYLLCCATRAMRSPKDIVRYAKFLCTIHYSERSVPSKTQRATHPLPALLRHTGHEVAKGHCAVRKVLVHKIQSGGGVPGDVHGHLNTKPKSFEQHSCCFLGRRFREAEGSRVTGTDTCTQNQKHVSNRVVGFWAGDPERRVVASWAESPERRRGHG